MRLGGCEVMGKFAGAGRQVSFPEEDVINWSAKFPGQINANHRSFEKSLGQVDRLPTKIQFWSFFLFESNGPMRKDFDVSFFFWQSLDKCVFLWTGVGVRHCICRDRTGVDSIVALTVIICSNLKTDLILSHQKNGANYKIGKSQSYPAQASTNG